MTSEGVIGPHYLRKAETIEEKDLNELKLKKANELSVKKVKDQRKNVISPVHPNIDFLK